MTTTDNIQIKSSGLHLHGVLVEPDHAKGIGALFLHGGGHANSTRYAKIQTIFADHGIASLAFDFRGCGESEGEFADSTLEHRLFDAKVALQEFSSRTELSNSQIYLWGSSMGAHVACRLTSLHPDLKGVILQSAAAYTQSVESIPLGNQFTKIISQPNSWHDSLAFPAYANYTGKKMVIYGEADEVIPAGIQAGYQQATPPDHYHLLPGGMHSMLRPSTPIQQRVWDTMVKLALDFILAS